MFAAYVGASRDQISKESNHVMQISRCIPLQPFGSLLGGKLIALLLASREIVQLCDHKYACNTVAFLVKSLHGKSSQYNRLEERGITFVGEEPEKGHGLYVVECKKH